MNWCDWITPSAWTSSWGLKHKTCIPMQSQERVWMKESHPLNLGVFPWHSSDYLLPWLALVLSNGVSDKHKSHQRDPEHMRNIYKNCSLRNQPIVSSQPWVELTNSAECVAEPFVWSNPFVSVLVGYFEIMSPEAWRQLTLGQVGDVRRYALAANW